MSKESFNLDELRERFSALTANERDVLAMVMENVPHKQIAAQLDMGLRTVELRRSRIEAKLGARHLIDVVRFCVLVHFPNERGEELLTVKSSPEPEALPMVKESPVVEEPPAPIFIHPMTKEVSLPTVGIEDDENLRMIGERFGITKQRVHQIEQKALAKIRAAVFADDELREELQESLAEFDVESGEPALMETFDCVSPWGGAQSLNKAGGDRIARVYAR